LQTPLPKTMFQHFFVFFCSKYNYPITSFNFRTRTGCIAWRLRIIESFILTTVDERQKALCRFERNNEQGKKATQ
jgi:hypothetical protein